MPSRPTSFRVTTGLGIAVVLAASGLLPATRAAQSSGARFTVSFPASLEGSALDGRLVVMLSTNTSAEPRFQIADGPDTQQAFGIDVNGLAPGATATIEGRAIGFPVASLDEVPPGTYTVQALLHRYATFRRGDGHTVKMPMDRGEGQQWNRAPGNLYSTPREITIPPGGGTVAISLDQVIPAFPIRQRRRTSSTNGFAASCCRRSGGATCTSARTCCPKGSTSAPKRGTR